MLFFRRVMVAAYFFQIFLRDMRQRIVGNNIRVGAVNLCLKRCFGHQSRALGDFQDALPDAVERSQRRAAHHQLHGGGVGHNVHRSAAIGDDVVNASVAGNVLAQKLEPVAHQHDGVKSGTAAVRAERGVGGNAMKSELSRNNRQRASICHAIGVRRMPVQNHIHIFKQAGADHIDFSRAAFLGGGAVIAQRSGNVIFLHIILHRDHRQCGARAKQIVPAAMPCGRRHHRTAIWYRSLREPWQGIEFAQNRDDRFALAIRSDEARWLIGNRRLQGEAGSFQITLQQSGASVFVITKFGVLPYLLGRVDVFRTVLIDQMFQLLMGRFSGVDVACEKGKNTCYYGNGKKAHALLWRIVSCDGSGQRYSKGMNFPRFVLAEQSFPDRAIRNIPEHIRQELASAGFAARVPKGARIAIGVGSRGISNISTIVKSVVEFWKAQGANPFIIPAMGSHGAASAEGQLDVLAHYGIHEATMGVPVVSSLEVVKLGTTPEGIETFMDKAAYESDGVFLVARVKWHTDFAGAIESGLFKMMAIGLGKFAGAQRYHSYAYRMGLEKMIRAVGASVFSSGKVLGGLAIQESAHHETAGLVAVTTSQGLPAMIAQEEKILAEVKSWAGKLPVPEMDILIVDEIGKNISGAGMDTKVINRSVNGEYNPWPNTPLVRRLYARGISELSYHSAVGLGMADVVHDRLVNDVDWNPTYINSLTASTPAAIRTPIHFPSDLEALEAIAPTVGKLDLSTVTYCRIKNTLELSHFMISENLIADLPAGAKVLSEPFDLQFDHNGDILEPEANKSRTEQPAGASTHM